jgi:small multidrug resistance pump
MGIIVICALVILGAGDFTSGQKEKKAKSPERLRILPQLKRKKCWISKMMSFFWMVGTTLMKMNGFTNLVPSVLMIVFYVLTLPFFTLALKRIDVGVAYAVWSAVGTASIAIIGFIVFKEQMNPVKITAIIMIIIGMVMLK